MEERKTARGGLAARTAFLIAAIRATLSGNPGGAGTTSGGIMQKNTFDACKGGGKVIIVLGSHNLHALIFPSLRLRIVTDDATNPFSMLEESVCDRAAHITGDTHNRKHVCRPLSNGRL
jgi:hypothetical protein